MTVDATIVADVADEHEWRSLAEAVSTGEAEVEVLKDGPRRLLVRTAVGAGGSAVVKLWRRGGLRKRLRRAVGIDDAAREWRSLRRLERLGVRVPRPLGLCRLGGGFAYSDAICMEDVGGCSSALEYMKRLLAEERMEEFACLESSLIETARRMLRHGMVDIDCTLTNFVVTRAGELVRLDMEMTRWVGVPSLHAGRYGDMIGRMTASFAFTVQPRTELVEAFARRLTERLRPPNRVLARARRTVQAMLAHQMKHTGIDTRVALNW